MAIAESTHWYTPEGFPMYTIIGANGKERNTNLRDAKKYNLVPSVTTVMGVLDKPALTSWKVRKALEAAYKIPHNTKLETFIKQCQNAGRDEGMEKAAIGTKIHTDIEKGFLGETMGEYSEAYHSVKRLLDQHYPNAIWIPEASFCSAEGYGGKVDLHGYTEDGVCVVVDFKTKDDCADKDASKLVYEEHKMQLSAYGNALFNDKFERMNIFVDRGTLEAVGYVHEDTHENDLGKFLDLLSFWKRTKNHNPSCEGLVQTSL